MILQTTLSQYAQKNFLSLGEIFPIVKNKDPISYFIFYPIAIISKFVIGVSLIFLCPVSRADPFLS